MDVGVGRPMLGAVMCWVTGMSYLLPKDLGAAYPLGYQML
jgi:hypothetical protein